MFDRLSSDNVVKFTSIALRIPIRYSIFSLFFRNIGDFGTCM